MLPKAIVRTVIPCDSNLSLASRIISNLSVVTENDQNLHARTRDTFCVAQFTVAVQGMKLISLVILEHN